MKKRIAKVAAVLLLAGGLLFNFGLYSNNSNNGMFSLKAIAGISTANAEGSYSDCCDPSWYNVSCGCHGLSYSYMSKK